MSGACEIAGVPGTRAPIVMDYVRTIGEKTGRLLPTGNAVDTMLMEDGSSVPVTLCDTANPCVFVAASELGLNGDEAPDTIMSNELALARVFEIQAKAGVLLGLYENWRTMTRPGLPLFVAVAPPAQYEDMTGTMHGVEAIDLQARLLFLGKCHESMAGTGAICTTAASRVPGSVVFDSLPPKRSEQDVAYCSSARRYGSGRADRSASRG